MKLETGGAEKVEGALDDDALARIETALADLPSDRPGIRLANGAELKDLLAAPGPIGRVAARFLGPKAQPVRAILFDKSEQTNWALGWHQDRTIAVREKVDVAGFGPWSVKAGITHVEPPVDLLERMVTLRVHLDPVDADNGPLLIAPGSHRLGRIPEAQIDEVVERCGTCACLADRETFGPIRP